MRERDALSLDFLNSEWRDFRGRGVDDRLQKIEWREAFLIRWNLEVPYPESTEVVQQFLTLRSLLRRLVEALPQGSPNTQDIKALNEIMKSTQRVTSLLWKEDHYQIEQLSLRKDWNWVMAEIATSFAHLLASIDVQRLKVCENVHCRAIFYDESHTLTRLYCCQKCSNLVKLRRFRNRHKARQEEHV